MIHCPRCQSPNILSNKVEPRHLERATNIAQATQSIGIRRLSVVAAFGAVAIRAINEMRKDYACADCSYKFDVR